MIIIINFYYLSKLFRTASGEYGLKDSASSRCINIAMVTSAGTSNHMMNVATLKSSLKGFFDTGRHNVHRWLNDPLPSRLDLTSRVCNIGKKDYKNTINNGLKNAFADVPSDMVCGYSASDYGSVIEMLLFGLRGSIDATFESIYSSSPLSSTLQERSEGFIISLRELTNYVNSFYSGRQKTKIYVKKK